MSQKFPHLSLIHPSTHPPIHSPSPHPPIAPSPNLGTLSGQIAPLELWGNGHNRLKKRAQSRACAVLQIWW
ncbi:MAG: hypothetical protein MUF49_12140 [Oculatellaceae cyanobacterium Prado106]|nr:hypothetical protein [Oculatellaceae cyanobacterium Prado106]